MHAVLERLFDLPAGRAHAGAGGRRWSRRSGSGWSGGAARAGRAVRRRASDAGGRSSPRPPSLLDGYFAVEDPRRLEPAERESLVEAVVDDQLLIRGYIDRLDVSPAGDLRVVDYKTGGAPREAFEARALFQLKFYALVLWRTRGVVPRVLRLLYLKDAEVCDYSPDAEELTRFERTLRRAVAGDRPGHRRRRTSGPSRAGCAAGAATRRCARRSAAPRRRSPSRHPRRSPAERARPPPAWSSLRGADEELTPATPGRVAARAAALAQSVAAMERGSAAGRAFATCAAGSRRRMDGRWRRWAADGRWPSTPRWPSASCSSSW